MKVFVRITKEDKYPTQMDHTHLVSDDYDVAKDLGGRTVFHKIQLCIHSQRRLEHGIKAHQYGDHCNTDSVYHNLKQQALASTTEQLSHNILL
jgi:hypothetical protein